MAFFEGRDFREKDRCSCRGVDPSLPAALKITNVSVLRGRMAKSARALLKRVFSVEAATRFVGKEFKHALSLSAGLAALLQAASVRGG